MEQLAVILVASDLQCPTAMRHNLKPLRPNFGTTPSATSATSLKQTTHVFLGTQLEM